MVTWRNSQKEDPIVSSDSSIKTMHRSVVWFFNSSVFRHIIPRSAPLLPTSMCEISLNPCDLTNLNVVSNCHRLHSDHNHSRARHLTSSLQNASASLCRKNHDSSWLLDNNISGYIIICAPASIPTTSFSWPLSISIHNIVCSKHIYFDIKQQHIALRCFLLHIHASICDDCCCCCCDNFHWDIIICLDGQWMEASMLMIKISLKL